MIGNDLIDHAARHRTVGVFAVDGKADDAAGNHIDDYKDAMATQQDPLATKRIHAPDDQSPRRVPGRPRVHSAPIRRRRRLT